MKPILQWIKKNIIAVICLVVIVVSLPVSWYFASGWNTKIREARQKAVDEKARAVDGARVKYAAAVPMPGAAPIEMNEAPNDRLTAAFVSLKNRLKDESERVFKDGEAFNKGEGEWASRVGRTPHVAFVPSLFPGPMDSALEDQLKKSLGEETFNQMNAQTRSTKIEEMRRLQQGDALRQMEDALVGKNGKADPFVELLSLVNAGQAPQAVQVEQAVRSFHDRRKAEIAPGRALTSAEEADLRKECGDFRLGQYQSRASSISVYAEDSAFLPGGGEQGAEMWRRRLTAEVLSKNAPLQNSGEFFVAQWDYWIVRDLLAAIRMANTDANGRPTSVLNSTVKKIEKINVSGVPGLESVGAIDPFGSPFGGLMGHPGESLPGMDGLDPNAGGGGTPVGPSAMVPRDPMTLTGRSGSAANDHYDVRVATLTVIVSSERLARLIDAIERVNFNTVLGVSLSAVDIGQELGVGYVYGNDHVVRATIRVETVWLRSWVEPMMPSRVRKAFKVPEAMPQG